MEEMLKADLFEAIRALEQYRIYGDCGRRSSAELARREKLVNDIKESYICALLDC